MKWKTLAAIVGVAGASAVVIHLLHRQHDPYVPAVRSVATNGVFKGSPIYQFSEEQLKHMEATPLDQHKFIRYLEEKWTLDRIRSSCKPANEWRDGLQNLTRADFFFETDIHTTVRHEFDRIYVYVCDYAGSNQPAHALYPGSAGTDWHRWTYSLNMSKSNAHWAIIEDLPNDFMDRK